MVDPAFALLAILLLAVVFGTAALAKLRDLDVFQGVVEQYQLLPALLVRPFVGMLPVVELGAALGLLLARDPRARGRDADGVARPVRRGDGDQPRARPQRHRLRVLHRRAEAADQLGAGRAQPGAGGLRPDAWSKPAGRSRPLDW